MRIVLEDGSDSAAPDPSLLRLLIRANAIRDRLLADRSLDSRRDRQGRENGRVLLPQGPPPPLSAVEIAALGGFVVTVKPRPYVSRGSTCAEHPAGPTPGALQGGDYPLTYDAAGNVELPACLDRRKPQLRAAA